MKIIETERYTLVHGDCLEYMKTLTDGEVDAVITDPPYGISHKSGWGTGGKWNYVRHQGVTLKNDDVPFDPMPILSLDVPCILWGANFYSNRLPGGGWLVWDKRPGIEDMLFNRSDSELAYISTTKTVKTFRHLWHGLCRATEIGEHYHPTQKPVSLMRWCIELVAGIDDTVFDPFMGSGTTGVACMQLGRRFIGCEIDEGYFGIAEKRIREAAAQPPLFTLDSTPKPEQLRFDE